MRLFAALPLLFVLSVSGGASAQDTPPPTPKILVPSGETFGMFRVELKKDAIDRSSPKALARSWGAIHSQEAQIAERFRTLFERAHLEILGRFYSPSLAAQQQKNYRGELHPVSQLRCQVVDEKEGMGGRRLVFVRRAWMDGLNRPREDRAQLMVRKEADGLWRLVEVRYRVGSRYERRDRSIPPVTSRIKVPGKFPEMEETPRGTFRRLFLEFRKLRFERRNAQHELIRHFFTVTDELYGAAVGKEMRANQPPAKPRTEFFFKEKPVEDAPDGQKLLVMMALERAKGGKAANIAGEAVFKMKKDSDARWRVVEEALRKLPGEPLVPVLRKIGLFLMG